jgi:hypothetical protein
MASSISSSSITYTLQTALVISSSLLVAADVGGGQSNNHYCPPSSCGDLHNISYPFRLQGDSRDCVAAPRPWYDLSCSNTGKATIQINTRTYYVSSINYTDLSFLVTDATMQDDDSSCPLPPSDHPPYSTDDLLDRTTTDSYGFLDLATSSDSAWACFVNCSRPIQDTTSPWYRPVSCLPTNNSFVYLNEFYGCTIGELQPSCRYLSMIPFDTQHISVSQLQNASYTDIIGFIGKGFRVRFPMDHSSLRPCLDGTKTFKSLSHWMFEH